MMEFPLAVTGIRPSGVKPFVYETLILFNQGVPYLFIVYDKILPRMIHRPCMHGSRNT
jgi:hypothetical protein